MDRGARWATVHGCKELDMTEHAPIYSIEDQVFNLHVYGQ